MAKDALSVHARDELEFSDSAGANPLLAAAASALAFSVGAALPTLVAILAPRETLIAGNTLVRRAGRPEGVRPYPKSKLRQRRPRRAARPFARRRLKFIERSFCPRPSSIL